MCWGTKNQVFSKANSLILIRAFNKKKQNLIQKLIACTIIIQPNICSKEVLMIFQPCRFCAFNVSKSNWSLMNLIQYCSCLMRIYENLDANLFLYVCVYLIKLLSMIQYQCIEKSLSLQCCNGPIVSFVDSTWRG